MFLCFQADVSRAWYSRGGAAQVQPESPDGCASWMLHLPLSVYVHPPFSCAASFSRRYGSPNAKFVTASLGETARGATDNGGLILDAMENVANATKYPAFKGNVAAVYTHPLEHTPGASGGHYGKDAQTYMNVGEAMGMAMVNLLKGDEQ